MTYKADKEPIWMGSYRVREHEVIEKSSIVHPKVSVIVPIYNMESKGFLDDLLGSLDLQTLDDIELVLVDDCSSDNTLDRLIDYSRTHSNVTLIHSVKNGRQGAARNLGLEYAKGAYIGFVDGDDAVDRDYYREMFNLAVKNNADIVVAPLIITDDRLTPIGDKVWQVSNEFDGPITPESRSRLILSPAHIVCSIYKASLFASCHLRFPENVFFEDNPTTFRLLCAASSVYTLNLGDDTPCYYYRQSMGSTDHRKDISNQLIDDRITTSCMLFDDAVECGIYSENPVAVDMYYLQIALLNTIKKAASLSIDPNELISGLMPMIRERVRFSLRRMAPLARSWKRMLQFALAFYCPHVYYALSKMTSR